MAQPGADPVAVSIFDRNRKEVADRVSRFAFDNDLSPAAERKLHGLVKEVRHAAYTAGVDVAVHLYQQQLKGL